MKADQMSLQRAQRSAWDKMKTMRGVASDRSNVTIPATLRQELSYVTTTSIYSFQFAANSAPLPTATLNNVNIGENDLFWIYGIQVLFGSGANSNNREYFSRGFTPGDNSMYNATLEVRIESRLPVINLPMPMFREEGEFHTLSGLILINPLRLLTGKYSSFQVEINLGKTAVNIASGVTITANSFISVMLHGAQARP